MSLQGLRIAWIGVGRMGAPMSRRLLEAGATLILCDRDASRLAPLLAAGAASAADAEEAARGAEISISMVPDDGALEAVGAGIAAAGRPGLLHIDMSTVSPATSARVAEALAPTGTAYLRCPVSGSTTTAEAGQLAFFVSGSEEALARAVPVLEVLGTKRLHVGVAEEARVLKLLVNMVVAAMPALLGEAIAFGMKLGLPRDVVVDALGQSVVGSPLLAYKAAAIKARDWTPAASVDLLSKDLDLAISVAREAGLAQPLAELVRAVYAARQDAGDGELDFFRLTDPA
jgi:3-hydroxyisobutyrate dehydrogenase-like beta-hydroxyacid dehydrogenase